MSKHHSYTELLRQFRSQDVRSYLLLETFIIRLLDHHLRQQNRRLDVGVWSQVGHGQHEFDAIAPDGIDDLPGPTLVDLRYGHADLEPLGSGAHRRAVDRIQRAAVLLNAKSVLIIYPWRLPNVVKEQLIEQTSAFRPSVIARIWDANDIGTLASRYEHIAANLAANLTTLHLEEAIQRKHLDWKTQRGIYLQEIRQAFENDELTLFLGAGVSIDAGLPDWNSLLDALFATLITRQLDPALDLRDEELDAIVRRLRDIDDASPLMAARYLRRGLAEGTVATLDNFLELVTEVLYKLGDPAQMSESPLLKSISRLCRPRRSGSGIRAVVTYNFDDLLEHYLHADGVEHRSIYSEGVVGSRDELSIYHVHGFLPRDRSGYDGLEKSTLVFSEEGYHELFTDPYHWSNLVQLNLLRETRVLMIGLSLTDPNLRRLLEIAGRRNGPGRHYAFLRRLSPTAFTAQDGKNLVNARSDTVDAFLDNHHRINEALFAEFGVKILWFEDYADLPALIDSIRWA